MADNQLRLIALDEQDLEIVSSHLQDAVVRVGDLAYVPSQKRFAAILNRFNWEKSAKAAAKDANERRRTALRFDRVLACKSRNIDPASPEARLELVGIEFCPGEPPGGSALLMFSHGGALRLDVECLECELTDLGADDLGTGETGDGADVP